MANCQACGGPLAPGDCFCGECGRKVETSRAPADVIGHASGLRKQPAVLWLGAGGALIALVAVAAIPYWRQESPQAMPKAQSAAPAAVSLPSAPPQPAVAARPGFLGVEVSTQPPTESETSPLRLPGGAYVESVVSGSPAAQAGLRVRDLIYSVNGMRVETKDALVAAISAAGGGAKVTIGFYRDHSPSAREVTLGIRHE
ncbi:MAG: PDZ domain-containing protein [Pseudorhodoplanes sp.]|nr:PDZ domain-containing protein [Pseudorhodoplanes sp.]